MAGLSFAIHLAAEKETAKSSKVSSESAMRSLPTVLTASTPEEE